MATSLGNVMHKIFGAPTQGVPPQNPAANQNVHGQPQGVQNPGVTNNLNNNQAPAGTAVTQQTDANGLIPADGAKPPVTPLDKHVKLWETPAVDPNAVNQNQPIDPQKLMEAASKVDFSRILTPENLAKVAKGGDEAVAALADLLNQTAQSSYGQSVVAANKMVELAVAKETQKLSENLPKRIRNETVQNSLISANPALSNPVVAPVVEAIRNQLTQQHPNATAQELTEMAQEILAGTAALFNPAKPQETKADPNETDWEKYLAS